MAAPSSERIDSHTDLCATFHGTENESRSGLISSALTAGEPTDERFVHFKRVVEESSVVDHRSPYTMRQIRAGLRGHVRPGETIEQTKCLAWFGCISNAPPEPFRRRQFRVLKDRSDPYRELVFALVAMPQQFAGGDLNDLLRRRFGAFHTVRPTQLRKSLYALVLSAALLKSVCRCP